MYGSNYFGTSSNNIIEQERPEDKEYPFYPPQLTPPEWEYVFPSVEGGYAIVNGKTEGPVIYFAKWVYEETMFMAKYAAETKKTEMACMLLYKQIVKNKPIWECFGYIPLPQEASSTDVDIFFTKHWAKSKAWLKENYPDREFTDENEGHWHVHSNMNTFFSGTDDTQQTDRNQLALNTGARIFVVVNEKKDIKARAIQYGPLPAVVDDIAVGVSYACEEYRRDMTKERREYLKKMVDDLVIVKYKHSNWEGEWKQKSLSKKHSNLPLHTEETFSDYAEGLLPSAILHCPDIQEIVNSILVLLIKQLDQYPLSPPEYPTEDLEDLLWQFTALGIESRGTPELIRAFGEKAISWLFFVLGKMTIREMEEAIDLFISNLLELISLMVLFKGKKLKLNNAHDICSVTHMELDMSDIKELSKIIFEGGTWEDYDGLFNHIMTTLVESER